MSKQRVLIGRARGGGLLTDEIEASLAGPLTAPSSAYCCRWLDLAITEGKQLQEKSRATLPGLAQAFIFRRETGKHTGTPVVYCLPGSGRGKARVSTRNIIVNFCPFCGKEQESEAL